MTEASAATEAWLALLRQVHDTTSQAWAAAGDPPAEGAVPPLPAALVRQGIEVLASESAALADGEDPETVRERLLERLREQVDRLLDMTSNAYEAALLPVELMSAVLRQLAVLQAANPLNAAWAPAPGPKLGVFQNHHCLLEDVSGAAARYREAAGRYVELLHRVAQQSVAEFETRLGAMEPENLASVRRLHQTWGEAGEAAYERVLRSDDYSEAFGGLTNAAVELTESLQRLWDEILESMNLPSRRQLDATQERLEQVRRRGDAERRELRRELDALRREVREIGAGSGSRRPAASATEASSDRTG